MQNSYRASDSSAELTLLGDPLGQKHSSMGGLIAAKAQIQPSREKDDDAIVPQLFRHLGVALDQSKSQRENWCPVSRVARASWGR